jgi:hypothetical protein
VGAVCLKARTDLKDLSSNLYLSMLFGYFYLLMYIGEVVNNGREYVFEIYYINCASFLVKNY